MTKTNKHKNSSGLSQERLGVKFVVVLPLSWGKRDTHKQIPGNLRKMPGQSQDHPRIGMLWTWEIAKRESLQKWLGKGAKGLFDSFGPREQRSPKCLLHHPNPLLHRCNPISHQCKRPLAHRVQKTFRLLHPLLTTFVNFHFSSNFPGPQLPNPRMIP